MSPPALIKIKKDSLQHFLFDSIYKEKDKKKRERK